MLEKYFVKPQTVDRIRALWLGPEIERYVVWLAEQGYADHTVLRRVPLSQSLLSPEVRLQSRTYQLMSRLSSPSGLDGGVPFEVGTPRGRWPRRFAGRLSRCWSWWFPDSGARAARTLKIRSLKRCPDSSITSFQSAVFGLPRSTITVTTFIGLRPISPESVSVSWVSCLRRFSVPSSPSGPQPAWLVRQSEIPVVCCVSFSATHTAKVFCRAT
jgi:hypothetical protein